MPLPCPSPAHQASTPQCPSRTPRTPHVPLKHTPHPSRAPHAHPALLTCPSRTPRTPHVPLTHTPHPSRAPPGLPQHPSRLSSPVPSCLPQPLLTCPPLPIPVPGLVPPCPWPRAAPPAQRQAEQQRHLQGTAALLLQQLQGQAATANRLRHEGGGGCGRKRWKSGEEGTQGGSR